MDIVLFYVSLIYTFLFYFKKICFLDLDFVYLFYIDRDFYVFVW